GHWRDRDLSGAVSYAFGIAISGLLAYAFTALIGRRLSDDDFATFTALTGILLALSGSFTAFLGGAAMAAAREHGVPRAVWLRWLVLASLVFSGVSLLPMSTESRAVSWFAVAACMSLVASWNRGILVGLGRL